MFYPLCNYILRNNMRLMVWINYESNYTVDDIAWIPAVVIRENTDTFGIAVESRGVVSKLKPSAVLFPNYFYSPTYSSHIPHIYLIIIVQIQVQCNDFFFFYSEGCYFLVQQKSPYCVVCSYDRNVQLQFFICKIFKIY